MPVLYKINVLQALKEKGYTQNRMRVEKVIGVSYMSQLRYNEPISWHALGKLCELLDCQPGDILKYVPDSEVSPDEKGMRIPRPEPKTAKPKKRKKETEEDPAADADKKESEGDISE